jgi:hypothetical protein
LSELLAMYGLQVSRWRLGPLRDDAASVALQSPATIESVLAALQRHVMSPVLVVPVRAEDATAPALADTSRVILAPPAVSSAQLDDYAKLWTAAGADYAIKLQSLDPAAYTHADINADLAQRALHAWRAGVPVMLIDAPWRWEPGSTNTLTIEPAFALWSSLAHLLHDRSFVGELPMEVGLHAWILRSNGSASAAIVAWTERIGASQEAQLLAQLADHDVVLYDLQGNSRSIPLQDGLHRVPLASAPVFITGVDPALALFRAGVAFEPRDIPSETRAIEASITLTNPWPVAIAGSLRINDAPGLTISPRHQSFAISTGGSAQLPITLTIDRSAPAGPVNIDAAVAVDGPVAYSIRIRQLVNIVLNSLQCSATWRIDADAASERRDLIIAVHATNTGERAVHLDTFIRGPGVSLKRSLAAALSPGQSASRSIRIDNGADLLAGHSLLVGIADRDGVARYNIPLDIPLLHVKRTLVEADADPAH